MKIEANSKLVFIGDSITQAGRNVGAGGEGRGDEAYGNGYVALVKAHLDAAYTGRKIRVVNMGIGGNTIRHLAERWERDALSPRPDWLSVMIGINDVWRQFDSPLLSEIHVGAEEFTARYRELLEQASRQLQLQGLVIAAPFVIDPNLDDPMRMRMDAYGAIARQMAEEFGALFVDTQAAFDRYMEHYHPNQLCWDRIHPSVSGHMLIARTWLDAVAFSWPGES